MTCTRCGADSCGRSYGLDRCNDGRFNKGEWIMHVRDATARWGKPKPCPVLGDDHFGEGLREFMPSLAADMRIKSDHRVLRRIK